MDDRRIVVEEGNDALRHYEPSWKAAMRIKLRDLRAGLADRQSMRTAQRRLSAELASFRSTAERAELDDILSRHPAEETAGIRDILYRQDVRRQQAAGRAPAGMGGYPR